MGFPSTQFRSRYQTKILVHILQNIQLLRHNLCFKAVYFANSFWVISSYGFPLSLRNTWRNILFTEKVGPGISCKWLYYSVYSTKIAKVPRISVLGVGTFQLQFLKHVLSFGFCMCISPPFLHIYIAFSSPDKPQCSLFQTPNNSHTIFKC